MLKHAAILAVATTSGLAAAQGLLSFASTRASAEPRAAVALPHETATSAPASGASAAQVAKAADGHYWAQASVNGRWVKFLVDTGASSVALTAEDAQRLGIDVAALDYKRPVITANGETRAAQVQLARVSVAGATVENVDAMVVRDGLKTSLLGMSYLGRLSRFEATPSALILRP